MAMDEMNEVRDFDEDIKDRKALIEEAKQLDLSKEWNEVASAVISLKKRWKRIYYWESAYEDELADEFDRMIDAFYAKRKEGFQNIQKAKQELIDRAQVLAKSENWNQATDEMNELMRQWKAVGSAGKETDDQLWEAFNEARNAFFDRKRQNWEERKAKSVNAQQVKKELIKQAAALADSEEWQKTSDQLRKLMEEWKNAGFAGKEIDDQLWNEFNETRQKFYDRRSAAYDEIHQRQQQNAEKKKELIAQAAAIVALKEYNRENTDQMKKLNGLWKEIGSCGKEKEDALWKEFRCAADDYFAGLKQFNEQKHNDWIKRMQEVRNRKMELIQAQQRQLKWMKNELPTLLSQTAADEMAEDIKDKEEFIQELENDLAEINEKLGVGVKK